MRRLESWKNQRVHFSIFDAITGLPAMVEEGACTGLYRHEVPQELLAAVETVQPGYFSPLPSLAALNDWQVDKDDLLA